MKISYRAGIYSNAIVLVIHLGSANYNVRTGADIKSISVVATATITGAVVNCHAVDSQSINTINANSLDRSVLDIQVGDGG